MKRLHAFVLKLYIGPFILTFVVAIFILLMQFIWKYIDDLVGKGLEFSIIAELLLYASSYIVPMALPLAILVASLMTFGNLGQNSELLALKASGISLQKVMSPLIITTAVICAGAFLFSNYVLPTTNLKMQALLWDIKNKRPELDLKAGTFNNDIRGYTIKVGRKDHETQTMYNVIIYDHKGSRGNTSITTADSAYMQITANEKYLVLTMFNGSSYEDLKKQNGRSGDAQNRIHFEEQKVILSLESFDWVRSDLSLFKHGHMTQNLLQLQSSIDTMEIQIDESEKQMSRGIVRTHILKKSIAIPISNDSIKRINPYDTLSQKVMVNTDSIFKSSDEKAKERILRLAYDFSKGTKAYITNSSRSRYRLREPYNKHRVEWHNKFTLAFACFVFFFVGAPLGAIIRKGGLAWPLVIASLLFIGYYVISLTGKKLSVESILPVVTGMWLAPFVILLLGFFLTKKAINDSVMLKIETYKDMIRNIFSK